MQHEEWVRQKKPRRVIIHVGNASFKSIDLKYPFGLLNKIWSVLFPRILDARQIWLIQNILKSRSDIHEEGILYL